MVKRLVGGTDWLPSPPTTGGGRRRRNGDGGNGKKHGRRRNASRRIHMSPATRADFLRSGVTPRPPSTSAEGVDVRTAHFADVIDAALAREVLSSRENGRFQWLVDRSGAIGDVVVEKSRGRREYRVRAVDARTELVVVIPVARQSQVRLVYDVALAFDMIATVTDVVYGARQARRVDIDTERTLEELFTNLLLGGAGVEGLTEMGRAVMTGWAEAMGDFLARMAVARDLRAARAKAKAKGASAHENNDDEARRLVRDRVSREPSRHVGEDRLVPDEGEVANLLHDALLDRDRHPEGVDQDRHPEGVDRDQGADRDRHPEGVDRDPAV